MIAMFLDGPIAGDVRSIEPCRTWRVEVPKRVTVCDCNPYELPTEHALGPEVVEYRAITWGPRVAIFSSAPDADDRALIGALSSWMQTDLSNPLWIRHCQDRRAFT